MNSAPVRLSKVRHWKQRWDPGAEFIWRRHVKLGAAGTAQPGDDVDKAVIGRTKLARLWNAGLIEIKGFDPKAGRPAQADRRRLPSVEPAGQPVRPASPAEPVEIRRDPLTGIRDCGKGWYEITPRDGSPVLRVRGRAFMEAEARRLGILAPLPSPEG